MRTARIKADPNAPSGFYHCLSRVVDRSHRFGDPERKTFISFLLKLSTFSGIRVLSFCILSNHFHLLLEVPRRPESLPDDAELFHRLRCLYSDAVVRRIQHQLESLPESQRPAFRERFFRRMWDLSSFMKDLKQRFTQWFNALHGRSGTLWEERFRSILVQPGCLLLAVVAAYIDLNPVRAGMVKDPEAYGAGSYAAAVAGQDWAVEGYRRVVELVRGPEAGEPGALEWYRMWLYGRGARRGCVEGERLKEVMEGRGKLSLEESLMCRVRYYADGLAIGSRGFVEGTLERCRRLLGGKRRREAEEVEELEQPDGDPLCTLRPLRGRTLG